MKKLLISFALLMLVVASVSCGKAATVLPPSAGGGVYDQVTTPPSATPGPPPPAQVTVNAPRVNVPAPSPAPTTPGMSGPANQPANDIAARLIVRNGNMLVMVDDIKDAIDQIAQLTQQKKGFVVSSQVPQIQQGATGSIVIRVPADEFDNTIKAISDLVVEVKSQSSSATDVTQEYTDLNSRLTNLLATEQQFLVILGKATTVTDILAVQRELSNTRQNIELTKGQIQYLQQTSSTSLITVTLQQSKLLVKIALNRPVAIVDETVAFHVDISGGFTPFSYQWDFGDKGTSTQSNPAHSYGSGGDRKITLKVTDNKGNVATDERTITVSGGWSGNNVVRTAWQALSLFGKVLLNILIWLGIFSPVWLIGGGIAIFFSRRRRKKKKDMGVSPPQG